jgi:hypothetical protein
VVACFLHAEIDSGRFGPRLAALLETDGRERSILTQPDTGDAAANAYRRDLLDRHRGWAKREGLFEGFPEETDWFRAALDRDAVLSILYINWDWWRRFSGGTRRPIDAAARIRRGEAEGEDGSGLELLARRLTGADPPQELILISSPAHSRLVVVEGHVRLTAYALCPECLPSELEVLLGVSVDAEEWWAF